MTDVRRVILLVLDGVGVGALPDADAYGDLGSNSVANTARAVGGLRLPHLQQLGLGNLTEIDGVPPAGDASGASGKMCEQSAGKDSIAGHWELCGIITRTAQPTYPHGFPQDLIQAFERAIGRTVLGNVVDSGTAIIERLGRDHLRTARPIVYTSADSVFQVAAHEDIIAPDELYAMCSRARRLLTGAHAVGRVIARPFTGSPDAFVRTPRRRDWALEPPEPTLLDRIRDTGQDVIAIGKIDDLMGRRSLTRSHHTTNNEESIDATLRALRADTFGLIFSNLIEFDQVWGHRNDPRGYAAALEAFDRRIPELFEAMRSTDVLMITGDHGCDPVTPSTDHSREYVPILVVGSPCQDGVNLGVRETFADVGQTVADLLGAASLDAGISFASALHSGAV